MIINNEKFIKREEAEAMIELYTINIKNRYAYNITNIEPTVDNLKLIQHKVRDINGLIEDFKEAVERHII